MRESPLEGRDESARVIGAWDQGMGAPIGQVLVAAMAERFSRMFLIRAAKASPYVQTAGRRKKNPPRISEISLHRTREVRQHVIWAAKGRHGAGPTAWIWTGPIWQCSGHRLTWLCDFREPKPTNSDQLVEG